MAGVLAPAAAVWGALARRRLEREPGVRASLPVVCIGNFTAGGTGKTPLALLLAHALAAKGERPGFLTRGYGSSNEGVTLVDPGRHTASEVGDEALLLAAAGPVVVSADRVAGAAGLAAAGLGVTVVLMDDGLQNPALVKDLSLAVVDGRRAFGNGRVIPAGPLRAPLDFQLGLIDAIVVNGSRDEARLIREATAPRFHGPVFAATPEPVGDTSWLKGRAVIAYAGIGNPERFYRLLESLGANVVSRRSFADHHAFSEADARALLAEAAGRDVILVTTAKDAVRLMGHGGGRADLRAATRTLPIALKLEDQELEALTGLISAALAKRRQLSV